jgi:phytoene dehydrogenase-like protein
MSSGTVDTVVIGAGANGLVAAARLGKRALVLEAEDTAGGQARAVEFAPGFNAMPLSVDPGWLPPAIARGLGLRLAPVEVETPLSVSTGSKKFLTLSRDPLKAAEAIGPHSRKDASKWGAFVTRMHRLSRFLGELYQTPAPDVDMRTFGDALGALSLARKFRALGRTDMVEFLRTLPLSAWELCDDWFEYAPLKAGIAAGGVQDLRQGPRSGGTGFVLLHHLIGAPEGSMRGRVPWKDGPDAFTRAAEAVARRRGATIRTGARVVRILVKDDAVAGVVLENGEEIPAKRVLSTADPKRTLLAWVDPVWLDPEFVRAVGNIRHRGCTAYVLYGLEKLPELSGLGSIHALAGVVSLTANLVALERAADAAKYGAVSEQPHVELHAPTILWPSLAPMGRHVLIARVQYAPFQLRDGVWDTTRTQALAANVTEAIEAASPGFSTRILHREALSPADLAKRFGLVEGAATQGELALDQILFMRPVAGWGRHATPIGNLYLGGAGTHPGPGILGGSGWLAAKRLLSGR